jgi:hypothetical protein
MQPKQRWIEEVNTVVENVFYPQWTECFGCMGFASSKRSVSEYCGRAAKID